MARPSRHSRPVVAAPKSTGIFMLILKGSLVSLIVALVFLFMLAIVSLLSDRVPLDSYLAYIMVGVTLLSIFIGSAWAAKEAQTMGLIIGMAVGFIYVLFSLTVGVEIYQESISWLVLANKLGAGLAAGALGGLVGVNL